MAPAASRTYEGGCSCNVIRYSLPDRPIYIHGCHCRYCQRETGAAFAVNAMYEAELVQQTTSTAVDVIETPTKSGKPHWISRCPHCKVALWSSYGTHGGSAVRIVRVGTLDEPDLFSPEMHIYTSTKQEWVYLDPAVPAVPEFYNNKDYWPKERLERLNRLFESIQAKTNGES